MEKWLKKKRPTYDHEPRNGEEMSLSRVGKDLYEKASTINIRNLTDYQCIHPMVSSVIILPFFLFQIFKEYTKKQWDKYPAELNASVLARLPFRLNNDDRYFSDPHQALPEKGYTKMFENMLKSPNIDVVLDADYFKVTISDLVEHVPIKAFDVLLCCF